MKKAGISFDDLIGELVHEETRRKTALPQERWESVGKSARRGTPRVRRRGRGWVWPIVGGAGLTLGTVVLSLAAVGSRGKAAEPPRDTPFATVQAPGARARGHTAEQEVPSSSQSEPG